MHSPIKFIPHVLAYVLATCFFTVDIAAHDQEVLFNRVNIQAQAERDIPNDEMRVVLVSEHSGKQPKSISDKVNADMAWALKLSKGKKGIDVSTRAYQTYPIYKNRDVVGWRVSQELQLKSEDTTKLSELVGNLQEKLQVRQMQFSTTKQTRDRYENELIEEALEAFKRRAAIVKKHMDDKDYRIIDLHVNTNGFRGPVVYQEKARFSSMAMAADAPSVEAGTSKLTVTVSGSIQFF